MAVILGMMDKALFVRASIMTKWIWLTLALCLPSTGFADWYHGVFEQQPPSFNSQDKEREAKFIEAFEKNKLIVKIAPDTLKIQFRGEQIWETSYKIHKQFLLANNGDGGYWVFFIKNSDQLFSSNMEFKRVAK